MISKINENLYIGEYSDIIGQTLEETKSRLRQLEALGIGHVLSLCSEGVERYQFAKEAEAFRASQQGKTHVQLHHQPIPISVESAHKHDPYKVGFQLALKEINSIFFNDPRAKVLVHCGAGVDRAPFLVASYLMRSCGLDLANAYKQIKKVRPSVCEHPEWK
jgi:protein-tyrosine phosphatase